MGAATASERCGRYGADFVTSVTAPQLFVYSTDLSSRGGSEGRKYRSGTGSIRDRLNDFDEIL